MFKGLLSTNKILLAEKNQNFTQKYQKKTEKMLNRVFRLKLNGPISGET